MPQLVSDTAQLLGLHTVHVEVQQPTQSATVTRKELSAGVLIGTKLRHSQMGSKTCLPCITTHSSLLVCRGIAIGLDDYHNYLKSDDEQQQYSTLPLFLGMHSISLGSACVAEVQSCSSTRAPARFGLMLSLWLRQNSCVNVAITIMHVGKRYTDCCSSSSRAAVIPSRALRFSVNGRSPHQHGDAGWSGHRKSNEDGTTRNGLQSRPL